MAQSGSSNDKAYPNMGEANVYGNTSSQGETLPSGTAYYHPQNPPPYTAAAPPPVFTQPGTGPVMVQAVVPTVLMGSNMGSQPSHHTCKSCNMAIVTRVQFMPSIRTHMMAMLLCLFGCWPCVCLPYCMATCNNVDHYCPNCGAYVGTYMH